MSEVQKPISCVYEIQKPDSSAPRVQKPDSTVSDVQKSVWSKNGDVKIAVSREEVGKIKVNISMIFGSATFLPL